MEIDRGERTSARINTTCFFCQRKQKIHSFEQKQSDFLCQPNISSIQFEITIIAYTNHSIKYEHASPAVQMCALCMCFRHYGAIFVTVSETHLSMIQSSFESIFGNFSLFIRKVFVSYSKTMSRIRTCTYWVQTEIQFFFSVFFRMWRCHLTVHLSNALMNLSFFHFLHFRLLPEEKCEFSVWFALNTLNDEVCSITTNTCVFPCLKLSNLFFLSYLSLFLWFHDCFIVSWSIVKFAQPINCLTVRCLMSTILSLILKLIIFFFLFAFFISSILVSLRYSFIQCCRLQAKHKFHLTVGEKCLFTWELDFDLSMSIVGIMRWCRCRRLMWRRNGTRKNEAETAGKCGVDRPQLNQFAMGAFDFNFFFLRNILKCFVRPFEIESE